MINITKYLTHFKSIFGLLAIFVGSFPFIAIIPPISELTSFFFPPLGDNTIKAQLVTFLCILLVVITVFFVAPLNYFEEKKGKAKVISYLLGLNIFSVILYLALSQVFIVTIEIPSESKTIYLSTGYNYTENVRNGKIAIDTDVGREGISMLKVSDEEKIRNRGLSDEDLKWIWTPASFYLVRFSLWFTYFIFILSAVSACSFAVYFDLEQTLQDIKEGG